MRTQDNTQANGNDIIIAGIHMDLTDALKAMVQEKVEKLFRHEDRIIRVKVDLEREHGHDSKDNEYVVKGHIMINGPDMNVAVRDKDCHKAIDLMVGKLDRMLRRRSRLKKVKRKNPRDVDIPASLPKV